MYFGSAAVRVVALSDDPNVLPRPEGEPLQLGAVGPDALTLRGPESEEERRDLEWVLDERRAVSRAHLPGVTALCVCQRLCGPRKPLDESGQPSSPHFNDEAQRYASGNLRPVYFTQADLAGHIERTYHPGQ